MPGYAHTGDPGPIDTNICEHTGGLGLRPACARDPDLSVSEDPGSPVSSMLTFEATLNTCMLTVYSSCMQITSRKVQILICLLMLQTTLAGAQMWDSMLRSRSVSMPPSEKENPDAKTP